MEEGIAISGLEISRLKRKLGDIAFGGKDSQDTGRTSRGRSRGSLPDENIMRYTVVRVMQQIIHTENADRAARQEQPKAAEIEEDPNKIRREKKGEFGIADALVQEETW